MGNFEALVAEGDAVPLAGWDFSWFAGRATEERPPWGYARLMAARLARVGAALDVQTGGGEVLASAPELPPVLAATESWPPNVAVARRNLPTAQVAEVANTAPLPFAEASFDLVVSRHPTVIRWPEIARVLRPGGTYFAQAIGAGTNRELIDFFLHPHDGPHEVSDSRSTARAVREAGAAGLVVGRTEEAKLKVEFFDVAAVVHFLRKVLWTVPGFTAERFRGRLRDMHELIEREGSFVSHSTRFLIEARKPVSTGPRCG